MSDRCVGCRRDVSLIDHAPSCPNLARMTGRAAVPVEPNPYAKTHEPHLHDPQRIACQARGGRIAAPGESTCCRPICRDLRLTRRRAREMAR
jgi:hypothetical protein